MSYCRMSSDNGKSDVYVYAGGDAGFVTVVAHSRINKEAADEASKYTAIDLPHAGERFSDPTREKVFDRLLALRRIGYHVPEAALERLTREMAGEAED